jgi:hypothetical protein
MKVSNPLYRIISEFPHKFITSDPDRSCYRHAGRGAALLSCPYKGVDECVLERDSSTPIAVEGADSGVTNTR